MLILYHPSNGGENTVSAEKLADELFVRVLYPVTWFNCLDYMLNGMRILINDILCEHLVHEISTSYNCDVHV